MQQLNDLLQSFNLHSVVNFPTRISAKTCIFVSNDLKTRELPFVNNLGRESVFEISAIEVVDLKIIVVCIYRPPNSNKEVFLELLEETLNKVQKKGRLLVLCGD
jgi:hypothetical protein